MLNIVLAIESLGEVINGAVVTMFCDNAGVLHSILRGAIKCVETSQMMGRIWCEVMQRRIGLYLLRVQSKANIADLPTRQNNLLEIMGANEIEAVLPMWFEHFWEVPGFSDFRCLAMSGSHSSNSTVRLNSFQHLLHGTWLGCFSNKRLL